MDPEHEECRENNVQPGRATLHRGEGEDTVDFGLAGDLKISLDKVSEAIYKKCVANWHSPPEELPNQPLYKEINSGMQSVFFNIKSRARPLEEYKIMISVASGFIAHFQNKRRNKVTYRFTTRQTEVDFLRKNIKCLLDFWLPEPMQRSQLIYVFVGEILSVNVLEPLINNFSDFTFINEVIVVALDDQPDTQQKEDSGRCDERNQDSNCSDPEESNANMESEKTISRKKEKKRIGKKIKGFFKSMRLRKPEAENVSVFRSCTNVMESDALHCDGDVADMGSCDDSDDGEISMTSVIDTSLQMWLQNNWTAKVSKKSEKEDEYEISVYDESTPDTVLWNTKRRDEDFQFIFKKIHQSTTGGQSDADKQSFHPIDKASDETINILLNLIQVHKDREVVFFFSPFEYEDNDDSDEEDQFSTDDESSGDSSRSSNCEIGFRTCNIQNEEEKNNKVADKNSSSNDLQDASIVSANRNKSNEFTGDSYDKESESKECHQPDGIRALRRRKKYKKGSPNEPEDLPSTSVARDEHLPSGNTDMRTEFPNVGQQPPKMMDSDSLISQKTAQKGLDLTGQNIAQTTEQQKQKLQETLLEVLYQLIDEVLAGGSSRVCFLHRMGFLKNLSKSILSSIPNIYAEEQIIWYLDQVAELLTSEIRPLELTPDALQSKALDLLKNKVQGLLNPFVKFFVKKEIMKNLKTSHQALKDPLANKETIYGLLEDLTKIITNEDRILNP
ncbi:uncharacterized protein LOC122946300 [Bufo gargarizans]|uniref:uncharacterized protein LOC122946300 n=1 Tax=Bufo gargarizans TaxID=30331 RepID=UPI001CF31435|nr:uncharacterized protein LOC122946300 [Bufo gargarizans]